MSVTFKKGNAVSALIDGEIDCLLHVCNNKGVMGSGIALEIKNRIPDAYQGYKSSQIANNMKLDLGSISFGWVTDARGKFVCNMVAQDGYGGRFIKHLNYGALAECLSKFSKGMNPIVIGLPYKMGADRAGGDWNIVLELVEYYLKDFEVIVYQLEG